MKESDDELKDFFSNSPPEEQFEFDKENWEKFHASLKQKRKNKKRLIIYLNLMLLLIGITVTYFIIEDKNQTVIAATAKSHTNHEMKGGQGDASPAIVPIQHRENNDQAKKHTGSSLNSAPSKNSAIVVNKATTKINQRERNLSPEKIVTDQTTVISADVKKRQKTKQTGMDPQDEINEKETIVAKMNKRAKATETAQLDPEKPDRDIVKTDVQKENLPSAKTDSIDPSLKNNVVAPNDQVAVSVPVKDENKEQAPETIVTSPKPDSAIVSTIENKDSLPKKSPLKNMLFFELGSDYLAGWKNDDKTEASGFNPVIGFNYVYAQAPKIGWSAGIQYRSISNFKGTSHTSSVTVLKFGEESNVIVISPTKIHYLAVPLKLNYMVNSKNSFGIGYTIIYLVNVQSNVETYEKRQNYQGASTFSQSMGYKSGFNNLDGQIAVCYRRQVYRRWYLNGELFYGTNDIKNNNIYNSTVFERSLGFRLTLNYNLFKNF